MVLKAKADPLHSHIPLVVGSDGAPPHDGPHPSHDQGSGAALQKRDSEGVAVASLPVEARSVEGARSWGNALEDQESQGHAVTDLDHGLGAAPEGVLLLRRVGLLLNNDDLGLGGLIDDDLWLLHLLNNIYNNLKESIL